MSDKNLLRERPTFGDVRLRSSALRFPDAVRFGDSMADERQNRPLKAFISYAHKDESLVRELETHMSGLTRGGELSMWTDRRIDPGEQWTSVLAEQLDTADLILVMVSADFLSSDYAYGVEFKRADDRARSGDARLVPVILRPVDWKGTPLDAFQALPREGRPVTAWRNRDEAFSDEIGRAHV